MKELLQGLLAALMAVIVSALLLPWLTIYSIFYSIYFAFKLRSFMSLLRFWWKVIDGTLAAVGHILYSIGIGLDMSWNVQGEFLEDTITAKEDTTFGDKSVTVSASVGKLEMDHDLNKWGRMSTRILNVVFWQKRHAIDSWLFEKAKKELRGKYFDKLK
jgi:hypothetical protein